MTLDTPARLRAMASPARLELMNALVTTGPCSVAELARAVDRPADALYRHLRILLSAGLVRKLGDRPAGRRREIVIDAAAEHFTLPHDPTRRSNVAAHRKLQQTVLKVTENTLRALDGSPRGVLEGPDKNMLVRLEIAWLTEAERARAIAALETLASLFVQRQRRGPERRLFQLTAIMAPVVRKRRAGARNGANTSVDD